MMIAEHMGTATFYEKFLPPWLLFAEFYHFFRLHDIVLLIFFARRREYNGRVHFCIRTITNTRNQEHL